MIEVYLALGSNLGDKIKYIKTAYLLLERTPDIKIEKKSSFYFSKAYGNENLNDFVNSVIKIQTALSPQKLLAYVKNIEKLLGRKKTTPKIYENRPIDIDILFYGEEKFSKKNLVIPHKDLENRDFVLLPLKEITEDFILPSGKTIDEALELIRNTTHVITDRHAGACQKHRINATSRHSEDNNILSPKNLISAEFQTSKGNAILPLRFAQCQNDDSRSAEACPKHRINEECNTGNNNEILRSAQNDENSQNDDIRHPELVSGSQATIQQDCHADKSAHNDDIGGR